MFKKLNLKKVAILASILGPFLLIGIILASIYIPYLNTKPLATDFVYTESAYCKEFTYHIVSNQLQPVKSRDVCENKEPPKLYYFEAKNNSSRIIEYDQIKTLRINTSSRSPDGFEILYRSTSSSGLFLWNSSNSKIVAKKDSTYFDISIHPTLNSYNFKFLAWVE